MVRDACWLIVSALFLFVFFVRVIVKDLSFSYLFASHTRSCRGHSGIGRVLTALWVCADLGFFASSFFVCFVVPVVVVFSDRALAALKRQGVCRTWTSSCLRSRPTACFGGSMQWTGSCQTTSLDKEASPRLGSSDCSSSPTSRCEAPTAARVAVPETSPRGRRGLREGGLWWRAQAVADGWLVMASEISWRGWERVVNSACCWEGRGFLFCCFSIPRLARVHSYVLWIPRSYTPRFFLSTLLARFLAATTTVTIFPPCVFVRGKKSYHQIARTSGGGPSSILHTSSLQSPTAACVVFRTYRILSYFFGVLTATAEYKKGKIIVEN